ncbi:probable leucine-rich repeat receptor-like protein kinase At1g35710 [Coffea eugenioides]|uniref:probable leucine-rich repeat receptor-like protein kinase At1g35710 n=1 Tax=Coffea eugenioides TaxID=49369 RepID=UPI000F60F847|nr:probable leucine-rich repeat receptor-like protein kinase At1g35710 [Coffea eugenioides]
MGVSFPISLCKLQKLGNHGLEQQLRGSVPNCLGNVTSPREIYLDSNALSSNIPTSSWKLKDLFVLNLSSNSLHGFVPPDIGNLKGTAVLDLSVNQLSNNIPDSIGDLQNLFNLSLAHNQLTGPIPESVGNVLRLELLDRSHNNLSGLIPREISKMTMNFKKSLQRGCFEYIIPSKGLRIQKMRNLELAFAECEVTLNFQPTKSKKKEKKKTRYKLSGDVLKLSGDNVLLWRQSEFLQLLETNLELPRMFET